jgi:hypothetical protein
VFSLNVSPCNSPNHTHTNTLPLTHTLSHTHSYTRTGTHTRKVWMRALIKVMGAKRVSIPSKEDIGSDSTPDQTAEAQPQTQVCMCVCARSLRARSG